MIVAWVGNYIHTLDVITHPFYKQTAIEFRALMSN